jgi:hypothetical protein
MDLSLPAEIGITTPGNKTVFRKGNLTSPLNSCVLIFNYTGDAGLGFGMNIYLGSENIAFFTAPNSYIGSHFDLIYDHVRYTGTFSDGDAVVSPA